MDKQSVTTAEPDVSELLRAHGILPTQQRVMIARVLFARCGHYSADQVMRQVNAGEEHVSKATVYNTLGLFARTGLVREVIVDPTRVFYDPNTRPHHHFYNIDSGELIDIDHDRLDISDLPEPPAGTVAAGVDVIIRIRNESAVN
ncbi:MAG: transcriptional repressor [Pseudomonadota bacterium]